MRSLCAFHPFYCCYYLQICLLLNQMTPYWLIRTKRSVWMASQILYVILSTCLYTVFLCLTELLIASPWAYVGNVWSQTAASIGYGSNNHLTVPVSIKTMEMTTPYKCAICVVFLMLFYSLFITSVMLVLNLQKGRAGGVVGALLINLYGILLTPDIFQKVFHLGGGAFLSGKYSLRMVITLKSRNISNA